VTAIGVMVLIPMALTLTSNDDTVRTQASVSGTPLPGDTEPLPANTEPLHGNAAPETTPAASAMSEMPAQPSLPPGGLTDDLTSEGADTARSVADWTDSTEPQDGAGTVTSPADQTRRDLAVAARHAVPNSAGVPSPKMPGPSTAPSRSAAHGAHRTVTIGSALPFDFSAAMNAVAATNIGPSQCGAAAVGTVPVAVTFSPSGRATRAVVENGALRGTRAGSCVATQLRSVQIAPFDGDTATIQTTVLLR
jgi:hypothetical protein